jgi:hypothetical protein
MGLALGSPNPLDSLAFDRHTQTPQDPAHLLLQNLSKYLISATLGLLSSIGKKEFVDTLASMELPQGGVDSITLLITLRAISFQITPGY